MNRSLRGTGINISAQEYVIGLCDIRLRPYCGARNRKKRREVTCLSGVFILVFVLNEDQQL